MQSQTDETTVQGTGVDTETMDCHFLIEAQGRENREVIERRKKIEKKMNEALLAQMTYSG